MDESLGIAVSELERLEAQRRALADFLMAIYNFAGLDIPLEDWEAMREAEACAIAIQKAPKIEASHG